MPNIDQRILPLIETLFGLGADWLAFEILDGIRSCRLTEESEEQVRAANHAVRSFRQHDSSPPKSKVRETIMEPLVGDEDISVSSPRVMNAIADSVSLARMILRRVAGS